MENKRHTARAIIIRNGKLLVFERWRRDISGDELHYYSIPGGGIEAGEIPEVAVRRELMEEMGIDISVNELSVRQTTDARYNYYFTCTIVHGMPVFQTDSPEAVSMTNDNRYEVRWVTLDEFESLHPFPDYQHAIETIILLRNSPDMKPPIDIVFQNQ